MGLCYLKKSCFFMYYGEKELAKSLITWNSDLFSLDSSVINSAYTFN